MRQKSNNEKRWFGASARKRLLSNWNMMFHVQKVMLKVLIGKGLSREEAVRELHHRSRAGKVPIVSIED